MMKRMTLALAAAAVAAGVTQAGDKKTPVEVPFKLLRTGHFLVKVMLNGKGPYQLIFDTGAPTMLINNRIANDSGVIKKGTPKPLFAPFGSRGQFKIGEMKIGELRAKSISTMVVDHPTVRAFSRAFEKKLGGPIDGIVGFPFFARYKMTVDYQAKKMTFVPSGYKPADTMQMMMRSLMGGRRGPPRVASAGAWGIEIAETGEGPGVLVTAVAKGSPAAKAGLKQGDRLLTIGGRWTDSVVDTHTAAGYAKPGKPIVVEIKRDRKSKKIRLTPKTGL